jgi:hypothetical protein
LGDSSIFDKDHILPAFPEICMGSTQVFRLKPFCRDIFIFTLLGWRCDGKTRLLRRLADEKASRSLDWVKRLFQLN